MLRFQERVKRHCIVKLRRVFWSIIFSRLTQVKYHRITRKNSAYWQKNTSGLFSYNRLIQTPGCRVTRSADQLSLVVTPEKKTGSLGPGQSSPAIFLSPSSFDSWEPVPEAKDLVVTLEKRTISYLSVSARIRVIDPFSQMKREYNTILDDTDSANSNNFVPSKSFTWCSPGNFSQGDQYLRVNC